MKIKHIILLLVTVFAGNSFAKGFGLDSLSEGLSTVQKTTQPTQQILDTAKQLEQQTLGVEKQIEQQTVNISEPAQKQMETLDGLTQTLVKKLGVTPEQAQGGAGAIFKTAQGQMDSEQFALLRQSVPAMDSFLNSVPKQSASITGISNGVSALLGDKAGNTVNNLTGLASSFKALNLSTDMVDQFVPVVVDYVRNEGGAIAADLLQSALYGN